MVVVQLQRYFFQFDPVLKKRRGADFHSRSAVLEMYEIGSAVRPLREEWTSISKRSGDTIGRNPARIAVEASAPEITAWSTALDEALTALRAAELRLVASLGFQVTDSGLHRAPGWQALQRRWSSGRAQQAFDTLQHETRIVDERYRPVREQIAARAREADTRARAETEKIWQVPRHRASRDREQAEQRIHPPAPKAPPVPPSTPTPKPGPTPSIGGHSSYGAGGHSGGDHSGGGHSSTGGHYCGGGF